MNGEILDRCVSLLAEKHKTAKGLCDYVNIPQNTFSTWKKRHTDPSPKYIPQIAEYLEVPAAYLLTGKAEKCTPGASRIPVYTRLPADFAPKTISAIASWETIPEEWITDDEQYIGLQIKDDEMSPWYVQGDTVIIRLQSDCQSDQDAVIFASDSHEAMLRHVIKTGDRIILQPLNPQYPSQVYRNTDEADEAAEVRIVGVVTEMRRKK